MSKKVTVAIELSESMVKLLNANITMGAGGAGECLREGNGFARGDVDARAVVAMVVLCEARGGREEETLSCIPLMWKDDIRPVCDLRTVVEEADS